MLRNFPSKNQSIKAWTWNELKRWERETQRNIEDDDENEYKNQMVFDFSLLA